MSKRITIAAILLVLLALTSWGGYRWYYAEDPELAKIRALGEQLRSAGDDLPREQRREQWDQLRQQYEALPEAKREVLRDEREAEFMQREEQRLTEWFKLSPEERVADIDRQLDRMQSWRERGERRRAEREASGQAGGERGGPGGASAGGPGGGREGARDSGPGRGGPGFGPPGDGRRGGWGGSPQDPTARNERRRDMLDRTSPEFRAMANEYRLQMGQRMQQRGMTMPGPWGGR